MWHVSLTRTCVGAIQEHTVLTCFKHFSCDMKLHTAREEEKKKKKRFSVGHRIMVHYVAKICGYSSFSKKKTCHSFSAVNIKPSVPCCDLIFNSTKRNSRQPDWAIFHEQHLKENNLHQRQEHWSVVSMVVGSLCALFTLLSEPTFALSADWTWCICWFSCLPETGSDLAGQAELLSLSKPQEQGKHLKVYRTKEVFSSHAHCKAHHSCEIGNS